MRRLLSIRPIFVGLFFLLLGGGCYPKQIKYDWGWATYEIQGTMITGEGVPLPKESFIVVQEYYSQFVKMEGEDPIYVPQARLVYPNQEGRFQIRFDLQASKIGLAFVAPGYEMQQFFFQRQLGVGDLRYQAVIQKTADWPSQLWVILSPFLQHFIIEQRFQMPQAHQWYLGEWLEREKGKVQKTDKEE